MRLDELPKSQRVEDRRGMTAGRAGGISVGTVVVLGLAWIRSPTGLLFNA